MTHPDEHPAYCALCDHPNYNGDTLCNACLADEESEPDFEAIVQNKHDRQESDFNARWPK